MYHKTRSQCLKYKSGYCNTVGNISELNAVCVIHPVEHYIHSNKYSRRQLLLKYKNVVLTSLECDKIYKMLFLISLF